MKKSIFIIAGIIILGAVILGGFYYVTEIQKQQLVNNQLSQQFKQPSQQSEQPPQQSEQLKETEAVSNSQSNEVKTAASVERHFVGEDLYLAAKITCTYPQTLNANYVDGVVAHELPSPEKNPIIFTFSQLDNPNVGQLSYLDSTESISNVSLIKLVDDEEKIIYLESDGTIYLTVHTIYKSLGISTYTKNINFLGIVPSVTSAMGTCVVPEH